MPRAAKSPRVTLAKSSTCKVRTAPPKNFRQDLDVVRQSLVHARAEQARRSLLDPLIGQVEVLGFSGYDLDLREDSEMHTRTLSEIAKAVGMPELDDAAIHRELMGRRPLVSAYAPLSEEAARTSKLFHTMREVQDEFGERAAQTYIISMTKNVYRHAARLMLAREAGFVDLARAEPVSRLDVVPLFETQADLFNGPSIMKSLFADEVYLRQLKARKHAPRGDARLLGLRKRRGRRGCGLGAVPRARGARGGVPRTPT